MIAFLIKHWKLLLDIIIVVGAIVLFTIFDPFNIYKKTQLKSTTNIVTSIKQVGELVSAEYYGETIASLHETMIYDRKEASLRQEFYECFSEMKALITENIPNNHKRVGFFEQKKINSNIRDPHTKKLKSAYNKDIYNHLIQFLAHQYELVDNLKKHGIYDKTERRVVRFLLKQSIDYRDIELADTATPQPEDYRNYINRIPVYFNNIVDFHYKRNKKNYQKNKKDIVFIGRGWVKAGFKFNGLDKDNVFYDKEAKRIQIFGLTPQILDKDINPWFIPEKEIKGFELVEAYRRATFEEAKVVKKRCKEKLLAQAKNAGIIKQAEKNGKKVLSDFFTLMLEEPELRVEFANFPYEKEYNMIAADTLVTVEEALDIDTLYRKASALIEKSAPEERRKRKKHLELFMNKLEQLYFLKKDFHFNLYSIAAAKILQHKHFITYRDYETLKDIRDTIVFKNNSLSAPKYVKKHNAYLNYPGFIQQFNKTAELIESKCSAIDSFRTNTWEVEKVAYEKFRLHDTAFFNSIDTSYSGDKTFYEVSLKNKTRQFDFADLAYSNFSIEPDAFKGINYTNEDSIRSVLNTQLANFNTSSNDPDIGAILEIEKKQVIDHETNHMIHRKKTQPIERFKQRIHSIYKNLTNHD